MSPTVRDLMPIAMACAASLALGFFTNLVRVKPLPLLYEAPEMRILRAVAPGGVTKFPDPETLDFRQVQEASKNSEVLFVDARAPAFFEQGHIPGAVNLPREDLLRARALAEMSDLKRRLIVYCSGEDCEDSRIVARGLCAMGYSNVSLYGGGWEEWSAAGAPVQK